MDVRSTPAVYAVGVFNTLAYGGCMHPKQPRALPAGCACHASCVDSQGRQLATRLSCCRGTGTAGGTYYSNALAWCILCTIVCAFHAVPQPVCCSGLVLPRKQHLPVYTGSACTPGGIIYANVRFETMLI